MFWWRICQAFNNNFECLTYRGGDRCSGYIVHTFRLIGTDGFAVGLKNDSNLVFPERKLGMTRQKKRSSTNV